MTQDKSGLQGPEPRLNLSLPADLFSIWMPVLSAGFTVAVPLGRSVRESLCGHLGLPERYLDTQVQTVFLNHQPVDDLERTVLRDGDVLSLSAAMPGLAGATMRRGGFFAGLRFDISHTGKERELREGHGEITLKLFNTVGRDLGPGFLEQGIAVAAGAVVRVIGTYGDLIARRPHTIELDGAPVSLKVLPKRLADSSRQLRLKIVPAAG